MISLTPDDFIEEIGHWYLSAIVFIQSLQPQRDQVGNTKYDYFSSKILIFFQTNPIIYIILFYLKNDALKKTRCSLKSF